jgi:hypothetical protein
MSALTFDPVVMILLIPIATAAILALVPDYRLGARINMLACLFTLLVALSLFVNRTAAHRDLSAGRRTQYRVHRAQHLRRLHHQRLQCQLHRP